MYIYFLSLTEIFFNFLNLSLSLFNENKINEMKIVTIEMRIKWIEIKIKELKWK